MSYTTDFIDPMAVINLHTAGLKVAEGMLKAKEMNFANENYIIFLKELYPALEFL